MVSHLSLPSFVAVFSCCFTLWSCALRYREAEEGARGVVNPLDHNDSAYPFYRVDLVFAGFLFPLLPLLDDFLFP
jgi:hypothetical protein